MWHSLDPVKVSFQRLGHSWPLHSVILKITPIVKCLDILCALAMLNLALHTTKSLPLLFLGNAYSVELPQSSFYLCAQEEFCLGHDLICIDSMQPVPVCG